MHLADGDADEEVRLEVGRPSRIFSRPPLSRASSRSPSSSLVASSSLCECSARDGVADCRFLPQVPPNDCRGEEARFEHLDTAYMAFRGTCICYGGSFVCARPDADDYAGRDGSDGALCFCAHLMSFCVESRTVVTMASSNVGGGGAPAVAIFRF